MEELKNEDIETSENNEEIEESLDENLDETLEETDGPSLEDYNEAQAKLKELEEKNKQLYARLKKTEQPNKNNKTESLNEEQLIKLSRVASTLDDDDLEVLKTINGSSLSEKMENPLFKAYKEQKTREERSKASALKPSSAGRFKGEKSFNDPNLSQEEHRKMVEGLMK
jgi:hypothetical protein